VTPGRPATAPDLFAPIAGVDPVVLAGLDVLARAPPLWPIGTERRLAAVSQFGEVGAALFAVGAVPAMLCSFGATVARPVAIASAAVTTATMNPLLGK
jgi:hypothetical protein